jgi:riboflavin biosynthesis pyrimidine reductase
MAARAHAAPELQPRWVVIENVRCLRLSPAVRSALEGDVDAQRNPADATRRRTALTRTLDQSRTERGRRDTNMHEIINSGDLATAVARLKAEAGGDIVQFGFGEVTRNLLAAGLLDRLRLWVHPVLIGRGGPEGLLYGEVPTTRFTLDKAIPPGSGIVILEYHIGVEPESSADA